MLSKYQKGLFFFFLILINQCYAWILSKLISLLSTSLCSHFLCLFWFWSCRLLWFDSSVILEICFSSYSDKLIPAKAAACGRCSRFQTGRVCIKKLSPTGRPTEKKKITPPHLWALNSRKKSFLCLNLCFYVSKHKIRCLELWSMCL